jgi:exodeoxyribonuclease VII small subunit
LTELSYEQALELLDQRMRALEDGSLSLEDSLKAYDEARVYLKVCQDKLEAARRRIEVRGEAPARTAEQAAQEAAQEELL